MRKGFTLLELIVVIIIIGILATLGFTQYTAIIERGRRAEARANLGTIRQMALVYYQENNAYPAQAWIGTELSLPTTACTGSYYFSYNISNAGLGTATRCTANGKAPNIGANSAYNMTLAADGTTGGSW